MGGISVGGGGGKKSLDSEIPLVPFIDLLLCCIMFLLVSAVWNQLARLNASQNTPAPNSADTPPPPPSIKLILKVTSSGYTLASTAGESSDIPRNGETYDREALRNKLRERKQLEPNRRDLIVAAEDGVKYKDIVEAMDIVLGEGFADMNLSDGAGL